MFTVDLKGASEALDAVMGLVVPWRRQNAKRRAKLENALRRAEIQRLNAETLAVRARSEREYSARLVDQSQAELTLAQARKTEAETTLVLAQAEKTSAEVDRERLQTRQAEIELAFRVVDKCAIESTDRERMTFMLQFMPMLDIFISNGLEEKSDERSMAEHQADQRKGDR